MKLCAAACTHGRTAARPGAGAGGKDDIRPEPTCRREVPWDELCEQHLDFVYRAVRRLAGPHEDVDDLVQEVFLVAQRRLPDYQGRGAVTTWLYGIAVRVVAGHRRGAWFRALRGRLSLDEAAALPAADDTAAGAERREAERLVYRVLDRMTEKRRTVLILYELEGLSGEEIAAALGVPLKTVWTRLHHARREFRERVQALAGEARP